MANDTLWFQGATGYGLSHTGGGEIVLGFDSNVLVLAAIPWELAYYDGRPLLMNLGGDGLLSCTRMIADNVTEFSGRREIGETIHLLTVTSYEGMVSSDRRLQRQARESLREAVRSYNIMLDPLEHVSMSSLQQKLSTAPPVDVMDYWGHGVVKNGCTVLLMEDDDGKPTGVDTSKLVNLEQLPPIIFLHACNTAYIDIHKIYGSLALELSRVGVKAVVAMQLAIRMQDVTDKVIPILYKELVAQQSIQKAVAEFRKQLYHDAPEGVSWYVPVLYVQYTSPYQAYVPFKPVAPVTNPFSSQGSAGHTQKFIGRDADIKKMWNWVHENHSFSIIGPAGVGKTRMMHLLKGEGEPIQWKFGKTTIVMWIDVYHDIHLKEVQQQIMNAFNLEKASDIKKTLKNKHTLLLLDNLGDLEPKRGSNDRKLLDWLASLQNANEVQFVATIRMPVNDHFLQEEQPPLYEMFAMPMKLGPFRDEDAESFIIDRLANTGYDIGDFRDLLKKPKTPRELLIACYKRFEELIQPYD
jgi:hypothetical protein